MKDKGFIGIWNNDIKDSEKEFRKEFLSVTSESDKEGFYTFLFSRYDDYKIITEVLYAAVYWDTVLFFSPPLAFITSLDSDLNVKGGDYAEMKDSRIVDGVVDSKNIEYIGSTVTIFGDMYETYTLLEDGANEKGRKLFENGIFNLENMKVSDDEIVEMSLNFLEYQIEKFQDSADSASEDTTVELNDNPLANRFYDKEEVVMRQEKKPLGDLNV